MNHRFQPEFCLRNYRSYFLIRNLSLSLTANSVTQARHKKHFFFSLSIFSLFLHPVGERDEHIKWDCTLEPLHTANSSRSRIFLSLYMLWQLQDRIKVLCSLTGILSLTGSPYQRERSPSWASPWHCWTSSLRLHLRPSSPLNASFPSSSVPFLKLTHCYFLICTFLWRGAVSSAHLSTPERQTEFMQTCFLAPRMAEPRLSGATLLSVVGMSNSATAGTGGTRRGPQATPPARRGRDAGTPRMAPKLSSSSHPHGAGGDDSAWFLLSSYRQAGPRCQELLPEPRGQRWNRG